MSPALLQADCALSALLPSRLPGLPATFAVLWYPRVVSVLVFVPVSHLALQPTALVALWCPQEHLCLQLFLFLYLYLEWIALGSYPFC